MKAMILAAGLGSRLKPITDNMPKALVCVGGRPMLEHAILRLKAAGFSRIVVNVHHFGRQIVDFLAANNDFGLKIDISDESDYLFDTGGGIKRARVFLDGAEPFLVCNVDVFSSVDLKALYNAHAASGDTLATLLVSRRPSSRQILFDGDNRLCGWRNRDTGAVKSFYPGFDPSKHLESAFGGVHVISPSIFRMMEEWTGKFSIIDFYLSVAPVMRILACPANDGVEIIDAGSHETLHDAEMWLKKHGF
ncbi:MAG: nucleotidyltransferase family protein [Tannerella sp.]|jgi:NDP-sugar pyrophosphorylase family protein|nr:nucleotidyltransferase family protein [Tannerella sp.]